MLSNSIAIEEDPGATPSILTWSCEFSPDASKLYVSTNATPSYLFQYDLNAANITASKVMIWSIDTLTSVLGTLELGPDNKIYLCNQYYNGFNTPYPYPDSVYNVVNMNLSVINYPDSLGVACDFQPFSFYMGGKRAYKGLPNNPDYDLPALSGSPCDTLVGIGEAPQIQQAIINVFYHSIWEKAFINASNLKGKTGKLLVYDMQGKGVHSEALRVQNGYYTRDLSMIGKAEGVYLIVIETEQERLVKKVLID
ncbi:MAG: T9SS type A sorting domain-containing protein [Bacteroidetes bacterium]|nr:T9SS type A sorting domain-containing protein [Bacteroidota bacterium]